MIERVVKVVRRTSQGLYSAVITRKTSRVALTRYEPGEWTRPRIGKLFASETLIDAEKFLANARVLGRRYEIWEAEAENPQRCERCLLIPNHLYRSCLEAFWSGAISGDILAPEGTVVCDAIKLVRRIAVV